ncbi:MAG: hypothetical protein K1X78_00530 [Verrucomicrobiaceae bacterium]|nr:hypothetical protein [Verrucomicrobiaceae bacterium]
MNAPARSGLPAYRYLRGYALDPGFSTRLDTASINEVTYRIPFEKLDPGPAGEYVEVIDFDPASGCWYDPVDLSDERIASQGGLAPSEGNPQFHQQFVYAVAMKTIRHFERALGRKIIWYPRVMWSRKPGDDVKDVRWPRKYVHRLRIHPHAIREPNAYYDPEKKAVLFGYFDAANQFQGANYPGGLVFTCLSPDIVAHEMTHAILDSIHHRYLEETNPDVAAFHEGFADIVALLQRFTFNELVEHQLYASGGRMDRYTVLGELATQFGEALEGNRGALRGMIGRWNEKNEWEPLKPSPHDYVKNLECHDRGAVLVATIFDAFQRIYTFKTRDLLRIATSGTGVLPEGSVSRDLVHRLAGEAGEIAEHLLHICIRALDYCPPNDITFGSYFRALITADLDIAPEDENGYRIALIEAMRARGIFPARVNTLSVESLRWSSVSFTKKERDAIDWIADQMKNDIRALVETPDREELYKRSLKAQAKLHALLMGKQQVLLGPAQWESFLNKLGMTSLPVSQLFGKNSKKVRFLLHGKPFNNYTPAIEVHTVRPAFRAGREGRQIEQVIVTLTQRVTVDLGKDGEQKRMIFRGGCSLILSFGSLNTVEHVVVKNIKSYRRFRQQAAYMSGGGAEPSAAATSTYIRPAHGREMDFRRLHRH